MISNHILMSLTLTLAILSFSNSWLLTIIYLVVTLLYTFHKFRYFLVTFLCFHLFFNFVSSLVCLPRRVLPVTCNGRLLYRVSLTASPSHDFHSCDVSCKPLCCIRLWHFTDCGIEMAMKMSRNGSASEQSWVLWTNYLCLRLYVQTQQSFLSVNCEWLQ